MGRDKAGLDWHGAPLLAHVCAVVRRGTDGGPVIVVRSAGQELPALPRWVTVVADAEAGVGPMQGLLDGLRSLPVACELVFLAGVDAPLITAGFVRSTLGAFLGRPEIDAAIPFVRGYRHPLLAGYRTGIASRLAERLAQGDRRAGQIFDGRLRLVEADELLGHPQLLRDDPTLSSVEDVDTPERFATAVARARPTITVERGHTRGSCTAVRLADIATAIGVPLDRLDVIGDLRAAGDPLYPLAAGDVVCVR
jgi:molybdopterin-guanine dinucleotide biosynthesis protein A